MERTPAWSPDGKSIAYFSDESGEYALHIKSQSGEGETRKIALAGKSAFYFDPKWSPDSKHIAFTDNQLNLWDVEIASGKLTKVDTDYSYELNRDFAWSGDSKWIAFVKSPAQSPARDFDLFARQREEHAGHRWNERCAHSRVRSRRPVSLFHGEHELRADVERPGHDQR